MNTSDGSEKVDAGRISSAAADIRLIVQQPALPKYRIPVFAELAARPGLRLKVYYGSLPGIQNVEPEGFDASFHPLRIAHLGQHPLYWHTPQWQGASGRKADALILSWDMHYASLIPALLRASATGVATVLWGHAFSKSSSVFRTWIRDNAGSLSTAMLTYNQSAAARLVEAGWSKERVFVARNCIDQHDIQKNRELWMRDPGRIERFKIENGLDRGPVVLFVSRLYSENRLDLLFRAIPRLADRFPGIRICIIGGGEPEGSRLRSLAADLGVSDRVVFVGPIYEEASLAPWFLSSDVFCYPSNIGLSILHAFGYGVPVVTSDDINKHNPEIEALRDRINGLLYADGDYVSLADRVSQLLADRVLRSTMSSAAHKTATEEYSISSMVDGFEAAVRYSVRTAAQRR